jgi:hypothetical protein
MQYEGPASSPTEQRASFRENSKTSVPLAWHGVDHRSPLMLALPVDSEFRDASRQRDSPAFRVAQECFGLLKAAFTPAIASNPDLFRIPLVGLL